MFSKGAESCPTHLHSNQPTKTKRLRASGREPVLKPNKGRGTCPAAFRGTEALIYSARIIEELSCHSESQTCNAHIPALCLQHTVLESARAATMALDDIIALLKLKTNRKLRKKHTDLEMS